MNDCDKRYIYLFIVGVFWALCMTINPIAAKAIGGQEECVDKENFKKTLRINFEKDSIILSGKGLIDNDLVIKNTASKATTFKLKMNLPKKWTFIHKAKRSITLAAGESMKIPFRVHVSGVLEFSRAYSIKAELNTKDGEVLQVGQLVVIFIKNYKRRWKGTNPQTKRPYFVDANEGKRIKTYFEVERDIYKANMILKNKLWVENLSERPIAVDINLSIPERWTLISSHAKRKVLRAGEKLAVPFRIFISPRAIRGMEYALIGKIISNKGHLLQNTYGYVTITKKEDTQIFFAATTPLLLQYDIKGK